jgi:NADPH:quinone reductase-like Zn-dependent oxidoreductase
VLTLGSGGVSLFALQFAKLFGARVISTTSSDEKAKSLKAAGADDVINYVKTPAWHVAVREMTGGRGVDQVVEIGGTRSNSPLNQRRLMARSTYWPLIRECL